MNERDSEAVAARLLERGYSLAKTEVEADVILLNTCSVRDSADQKALGKMKALAGNVRAGKSRAVLGFLGCMAQARGQALMDAFPDIKLVLGTQKTHKVGDSLDLIFNGNVDKICDVSEEFGSQTAVKEHLPATSSVKVTATSLVSIMQGCNQHCTFCIVPQTRGEERCRSIEDITEECRQLVSNGIREVILLGQIVTSYGKRDIPEKDGKSPFVQLLEAISLVEGLQRIRFTAPHPKGYGDDLVEAYGRLPKLCESAHIPVQSGSDRILKLMHRGYNVDRVIEILEKLRQVRPNMGITTDMIVGFPGETEADFEATLDFVRRAKFDNAYLFKYSPRKETPAAALPDQLPDAVKEERHAELLRVVSDLGMENYIKRVGDVVQVLVEGPSKRNAARLTGRSRCNKIVLFTGQPRLIGQLLDIQVTRAGNFTLYGEPVIQE